MVLLKKFEQIKERRGETEQFQMCLGNMAVSSHSENDDPNFSEYTSEWFRRINRGGLFPVNDITFSFFLAIETVTRPNLPKLVVSSENEPKEVLTHLIKSNEDVQFYWTLLPSDIEEEESAIKLLSNIVEKWVTIRGFSLSSTWVEEYNRTQKNKICKKKRH